MHQTAVNNRLNAMQRGLALLEQAADAFDAAKQYKLANAVNHNIEVAGWELRYFIEQHGPIVERKK